MTSDSAPPSRGAAASPGALPVRARQLLSKPAVWGFPLISGSILVLLLATFYIGAVVDPVGHLHGLPVAIVNEDHGATVGAQRINFGQQVQSGLSRSAAVASKLGLSDTTLRGAEHQMDSGGAFAAVVIPASFSASLLGLAGVPPGAPANPRPEIVILTNQRAGTQGVSLATGVLEPALAAASGQIGKKLIASMPAGSASPVTRAFIADPVTIAVMVYRPLPSHSAVGLSAFYIALLTLICGFLGGTIVNTSVDAALGYATSEVVHRWRQRRPMPISRWQTLLIKWAIAPVAAGLFTGLMLIIAAGALGMDAPHVGLLWLFAWLAAASVAAGTIVLFAVLGASIGQPLALVLFVYAGLASAGGTVPIQALPPALRWIAGAEPLRQILAGTRSILYFNAQADAGLTRGVAAAAAGLAFWLIAGTLLVRWYDRRGLARLDPDLLEYVSHAADHYQAGRPADRPPDSGSEPG